MKESGMRKEAIFGAVIRTFSFNIEKPKATYHALQERGRDYLVQNLSAGAYLC